ncbi:MAG: hypothetical protein WC373_08545 [Smithella sp.]|jgi:hypothetical protein
MSQKIIKWLFHKLDKDEKKTLILDLVRDHIGGVHIHRNPPKKEKKGPTTESCAG